MHLYQVATRLERQEETQGWGGWTCSRIGSWFVPLTVLWAPPGNPHSNLTAGQVNGNGTNLVSPIDTSLSHGAVHLSSPDYNYSPEYGLDVATLSRASSNFGLATTSPLSGQYNLDGTQRLSHDATNSPRDAFSAFYFYFYSSHPFCLPRQRLYELLKERRAPLLELAVQYIGSCFLPSVPTELYDRALEQSIQNGHYPKDGYSLQGLLLFAIGLHANNKVPRAAQIFNIAIELTLALGVNRPEFSLVNAAGDRVLEESWRRTWWSMYVANGMMAAVNPGVQFRLKDAALDVPLPCEDDQYLSGVRYRVPYILSCTLLFLSSLTIDSEKLTSISKYPSRILFRNTMTTPSWAVPSRPFSLLLPI
jgi:hypothetical protein